MRSDHDERHLTVSASLQPFSEVHILIACTAAAAGISASSVEWQQQEEGSASSTTNTLGNAAATLAATCDA